MELNRLGLRYITGVLGMFIVAGLIYTGDLSTGVGVGLLVGILLSLGAYDRVRGV